MLLMTVVEANKAEEMINSPDIKPITPVRNAKPFKISFCKSFIFIYSLINTTTVYGRSYSLTIPLGMYDLFPMTKQYQD